MANIPFLLDSKFNLNPLLQQTFHLPQLRTPPVTLSYGGNNAFRLNYSSYKGIRYSPKLRTKCFSISPKPKGENGIGGNGYREDNDLKAVAISSGTPLVEKTSVLKLQVGLSGKGRSLQRELNQIAETADTSSPEGFYYILQETIRALLRHQEHCISGYSSVDARSDIMEVEILFNELSIEERGKFDEETLVNVNNRRMQRATTQKSNEFSNKYIVITIIVAAGGVYQLPPINSISKLKEALQKLMTINSEEIKTVEVLWTPQDENDILTEQEYLEDYSLLRPLSLQD